MRVRLLRSNTTSSIELQYLTTFLINDHVALDGGSVGMALRPEEMREIRHVLLSHTHSDHTASLPIFIAEAFTLLDGPVTLYGTSYSIEALEKSVFNDSIWPDFRKIPLMDGSGPSLILKTIVPDEEFEIEGLRITPISVNHTIDCVGFVVSENDSTVVFTCDTYHTEAIWDAASDAIGLKAIFADVSFPNELESLAEISRHYTPQSLASDLKRLRQDVDIYAVHIKPTNRDQVIKQLLELEDPRIHVAEIDHLYQW